MRARATTLLGIACVGLVIVLCAGCPSGSDSAESTAVAPTTPAAPSSEPATEPATEPQPEAAAAATTPPEEMPATFSEAWGDPTIVYSFERKIVEPGGDPDAAPVAIVAKYGNDVLLHLVAGDGWTIVDPTQNFMCKYDPGLQVAVAGPLDGSDGLGAMSVPVIEVISATDFPGNPKLLGQEDVDGVPCYYAEVVPAGKVETIKVWLDIEYGLLRQQEDERGVSRLLYSRINKIDRGEFAVPKDVKVLTRAQLKQASGSG